MMLKSVTDTMPFGKYRGELIGTIMEDDPAYMRWAVENTDIRLDKIAMDYLVECES